MNIEIIETTIEELDVLTELFDQYMVFYKKPSDINKYRSYLKERLQNKEANAYLAIDDNTNNPLGFVLNYHSFSSVSLGRIVVLNDLFVMPEYRKKGIAERLINSAFDLAKQVGAIRVDLGTGKDNYTAQRLYEKIGFVKDEDFYSYSYII
ncbi:GNAT family N-acetyltransferase [Aquimarina spinulae]|uniref:GNAT family N-acetyltransferase n=1 Tax=Aquimarina spinulae TaxID=1192023 RepID=UPI000D562475|nr:GNAT family N-acetyltransferase [Aquimarina spinulae]